ncbi:MAG: SDR family oxidoreductase [Burkholderiaceae bacterium]
MKILVVGATGVLGRATVQRLLAQGFAVRAMTRSPERAADLAAQGAEVVAGDLIDRASLTRACAGVDRVFAAAHAMLGRGRYASERVDREGHRALIDAAQNCAVQRFVYTSVLGADTDHPVDFFRTKSVIEQHLRGSGLPHVILRPTAFMEHHVHTFNGKALLGKGQARLIGSGTKLRNFVAGDDVAQFAVLALTAEPVPGPLIEIGGPGNFTNNEVAELYARLAGVAPRISHLPASVARMLSRVAAPLHPGVARLMRLLGLPDDAFEEAFDSAALQRAFPALRLTSLETFVRARVAEAGITPAT